MPQSSTSAIVVFSTLLSLLPFSFAAVSMQDVQPVVGFNTQCTAAYATVVVSCSLSMFKGVGQPGSCSAQCFQQLGELGTLIVQQCQGQQASGGSLIADFFTGTGAEVLCGFDSGSASSTTVAVSATTTSASAAASASTSSSSSSSTSSSSTSSLSSSSASTSLSSSTRTSTVASSASTNSPSTSTSSSSSTSSSAQTTGQIGLTGGGSPFDVTTPNTASPHRSNLLLGVVSACVGLLMTMR